MLRAGFLRTVSDWVSIYYADLHPVELNRATEEFGLDTLLKNVDDPDKLLGMFSEWLVFDRKSPENPCGAC